MQSISFEEYLANGEDCKMPNGLRPLKIHHRLRAVKTVIHKVLNSFLAFSKTRTTRSHRGSSATANSSKSKSTSSEGGDPEPETAPTRRKVAPFSKITRVIPSFFLFLLGMILSAHLYCEVAK